MKTVKDDHLSILKRPFGWRGGDHLAITVMAGFCLTEPGRLYPEAELWNRVVPALGRDRVLDMGMPKPRAEVLVFGKCFPPRGTTVQAARAGFRIDGIAKTLQVTGDRHFRVGGPWAAPTEPKPFAEMDLTWKNAYGGPDLPANPSGKGMARFIDQRGNSIQPLPNIMKPGQVMAFPDDRPEPVGVGPIGLDWPIRTRVRGTFDDNWLRDRWPGFPDDFDFAYFNQAPEDQRRDALFCGDEPFRIQGMHPDRPEIDGRLPGLRCRLFVLQKREEGEAFIEISAGPDTLCLVPHEDLGILIWHGIAPIADDEAEDILVTAAFTEALADPPPGMECYLPRLCEPPAEAAAVEVPEPEPAAEEPEPAREEEAAPETEIPDVLPGQEAMEAEIARIEQEIDRLLLEQGIDPAALANVPPIPPRFVLPAVPVLPPEAGIEGEIAALEQQLDQALIQAGIDPAALLPPEPVAQQVFANADEMVKFYVDNGITDPHILAEIRSLAEEMDVVNAELAALAATPLPEALPVPPAVEAPGVQEEPGILTDPLTREDVLAGHAEGRSFSRADLAGLDLSGADLTGIDLAGAVLEGANLAGSNLAGAGLRGAVLTGADLSSADLTGADLTAARASGCRAAQANLSGARFSMADFSGADLSQAILAKADLSRALFRKAVMAGVDGSGATAQGTGLADADLTGGYWAGADLTQAELTGAILKDADFTGATARDADVYAAQGQGARFREADLWRIRAGQGADFTGGDFYGANLGDACWEDANLSGCNLSGARLEKARFNSCNLTDANLAAARARGANLAKCDLSGSRMARIDLLGGSLRKARLVGADCALANLYRVDFYKSVLGETDFTNANLDRTLITLFGIKP